MFLLRGLIGIICFVISIVGMLVALNRPVLVVVPLVFVPLGLWIMGYITHYAPIDAQLRNYAEERKIRAGRHFGLRNRVMGCLAVLMGTAGLFIWFSEYPKGSIITLLGGLVFTGLGLLYLISGAAAEDLRVPYRLQRLGVTAEMLQEHEKQAAGQLKEHYDLLQKIENAGGVMSPEHLAEAEELLRQLVKRQQLASKRARIRLRPPPP